MNCATPLKLTRFTPGWTRFFTSVNPSARVAAARIRRSFSQEKGRHLWIWADRLLDGKTSGLGEWEASTNGTARAIDLIPKDVMLCDWHYDQAVPTAPYFAMKGFHVVTCPWKSSELAVWQADDIAHWRSRSPKELK